MLSQNFQRLANVSNLESGQRGSSLALYRADENGIFRSQPPSPERWLLCFDYLHESPRSGDFGYAPTLLAKGITKFGDRRLLALAGTGLLAATFSCHNPWWPDRMLPGGQGIVNRLFEGNMSRIDTYFQLLKDVATYCVVRLVVCVIQALPIEVCARLAKILADCCAARIRSGIVQDNLSKTFPQWSEQKRRRVAREMWEHLFLMICEIAHAPRKIHDTNWRRYVKVNNPRELVGSLTDPRPVVVVAGHYGNFELGGYIGGLLGFPTYTVARTLDNRFLDQYLNHFRQLNGQHTLPKEGTAALVAKVMERGETLCLLGDQHAGTAGVWIEFMGRPASCHKALALFTLTGGAPMLVSYARRLAKPLHFEIGVQGMVDPSALPVELQGVRQLTQWYNSCIEQIVRVDPTQYWWVHRRWREKPKRYRKTRKNAAA